MIMDNPVEHLTDDLWSTVLALAAADRTLPEDAKQLVLDTIDGDCSDSTDANGPEPVVQPPVYLKAIRVKGFRGVGPEVQVPLRAGPGWW